MYNSIDSKAVIIFLSGNVSPSLQYGSPCLPREMHSIHRDLALYDGLDGVYYALSGGQVGAMARG
jgi:hypothetical protein